METRHDGPPADRRPEVRLAEQFGIDVVEDDGGSGEVLRDVLHGDDRSS